MNFEISDSVSPKEPKPLRRAGARPRVPYPPRLELPRLLSKRRGPFDPSYRAGRGEYERPPLGELVPAD
ncbi:MAG: hypothetical protein ACYCPH_01730 [Minisyncoccota bacterium]